MKIKENISLANWTTFKIGGLARYFLIIDEVGPFGLSSRTSYFLRTSTLHLVFIVFF